MPYTSEKHNLRVASPERQKDYRRNSEDPANPGWPKRIQASFEGKNEEGTMELETVEINRTGMYYLYFVFCDPELKGTLITGRTVWKNHVLE
ncbi:hypothetical protein M569_05398 [Genlisea aurea]|uniref:Uncharacterized protein n=1 Tax=Genlisea aurea TaxID=192259 RepID=S8CRH0_9LAMI|nr:hypothetical protein M569_05398 [Genlisea aurea]